MATYEIAESLQDMGYTLSLDRLVIRHVDGVSDSYGPGGYGVGITSDRSRGYLYGKASVISAYHNEQPKATIDRVADGDTFVIEGMPYVLKVGYLGKLDLVSA